MKLLLISAFALCLSLEAFALPASGKATVAKPSITAEDLAVLQQSRPIVKRYNVQTQGRMLKVEEPRKPAEAKAAEGQKAL